MVDHPSVGGCNPNRFKYLLISTILGRFILRRATVARPTALRGSIVRESNDQRK